VAIYLLVLRLFFFLKKKELNKLLVNGYNKSINGQMSIGKLCYLFIYDNKYDLKNIQRNHKTKPNK